MPNLFLLGVVPEITADEIENHLKTHLQIYPICTLLPEDCAAAVSLLDEDYERLSMYRFIRVRKHLIAVSTDDPSRSEGPAMSPLASNMRFSLLANAVTQLLYRSDSSKKAPNVYKVCLTGGPCAGKTTILSTIMAKFPSHGVHTYAVPEAATILITGGMSFVGINDEQAFQNQLTLLKTTLDLERHFLDLAASKEGPSLIVCDRGAMDGRAYCDEATWNRILTQLNVDTVQLRDQQYDAVYHMVTAAEGAELFYGSGTNAARLESLQEARDLDARTLSVYLGHPHLRIIDNSTDFASKVERVISSISEGMGITIPTNGSYRRYLVSGPVPAALPVPAVEVKLEIAILRNPLPEPEMRIISRQQDGNFSYFFQKYRTVNDKPVVTERKLTAEEYQDLRKQIDYDFEVIRKSSLAFTYNRQYFELGTFITPEQYKGLALLYIEIGTYTSEPDLPPFIPIEREVTNDPQYTNMMIRQSDFGALETGRSFTALFEDHEGAPNFGPLSLKSPKARASFAPCWPSRQSSLTELADPPFGWLAKRSSVA